MDHPPYLTLDASYVTALRSVPPPFPVWCFPCLCISRLGGAAPQLLLICTPDSRLQSINSPAFHQKRGATIGWLLFPFLWRSLAPECAGFFGTCWLPVSSCAHCLSCSLSFQTPVCATQPAPAVSSLVYRLLMAKPSVKLLLFTFNCCVSALGGSVSVCSSQQKRWSSQPGRKSRLSSTGDDG